MFEDTMKMNRNIKITESQYRMLQEADEEMFPYVTDNDAKPFNGYGDISADGKKSGEENADTKTTADKVQQMRTMDGWNRYRTYGNVYPTTVREDTNKENDFYDANSIPSPSKELDILSNGNENDDLIKIPVGVDKKCDILLDSTKILTPKQQAIVLNKMIEELDTDNIPYQWKKELIEKLK